MSGPDPALAAVLHRFRQRAGVTQEALAFRADLTIATMSRMERGVTDPAWTSIRAVARALDVGLGELGAAVERERCGAPSCLLRSGHA
ncbi:MAG TPA: helix-turn-helix transcriptional regulator [Solirubrobacteraceae bacterium]|jgi:transcriptional regulator with XRE-family HTH domain|nr:helix-turn-helix transcriptional regulator [Solirubrobacteraceae bacterium]